MNEANQNRDTGLDIVKWLGMATMVLDHLRYLWHDMAPLYLIGRLSFPLFCLAIAVNVTRSRRGELYTEANVRYLTWMLLFVVISEPPYRMLSSDSSTFSVMLTLMLGLIVAWGCYHRDVVSIVAAAIAIASSVAFHDLFMYGVSGVLIPAALVLAIRKPGLSALLPAMLCVMANNRDSWMLQWGIQPYPVVVAIIAFSAPLYGLWLLRKEWSFKVPPVTRWGYFFYPGHLLALASLRYVVT
ncbi:TraX family protein [Metapseudomonas otitidis]|uniref:TraX family protein n=1 Tax=Metapseudomonas otitidis TaxID=319939 RepID=UPI00209A9A37|nr:TraX family protein [Pseudomonas otitidis]MCO7556857.1 conjugal transfer protein TraX [Pseudomonas otitidis]